MYIILPNLSTMLTSPRDGERVDGALDSREGGEAVARSRLLISPTDRQDGQQVFVTLYTVYT